MNVAFFREVMTSPPPRPVSRPRGENRKPLLEDGSFMLLVRRKPIDIRSILLPPADKPVVIPLKVSIPNKRSGGDRRGRTDRRETFMEVPEGFQERRRGSDRRSGYDRRDFASM